MAEESHSDYSEHRITRYCDQHPHDSSYVSCHQEHNEDFKGIRLDAAGIYYRLEYVVVNDLCDPEYGYENNDKHPETYIQAAAV